MKKELDSHFCIFKKSDMYEIKIKKNIHDKKYQMYIEKNKKLVMKKTSVFLWPLRLISKLYIDSKN